MLAYRDEIDGLRAVAVIPVILYHAGFDKFFSGGYVGVDIFFVISGYLITSVIKNECDNQTFSLLHFYERRCRRILPALFIILFLTTPFAYHWMLPDQLQEFGQTLISIISLSSNFFFWWKDDGYFARLTELNPLVHTWSLAVEEQFYFVFPLLCYFFNHNKQQLFHILLYSGLMSFFFAQWGDNLWSLADGNFRMFAQHRWATFYLPTGRIWELLLGSFAAFYLRNNNPTKDYDHKWRQALAFLGLIFIGISVVFFHNLHIRPFPNCYTLLPTCGAVLVIVFGDKTTFVGSLLSQRLIRGIGLISYSAYLWHQPLLAFLRIRFNESPPFSYVLIAIIAVLPLSIFSYFYIEQPFRQKSKIDRKRIFSSAAVTTMVTFILALFLIQIAHNRSILVEGKDSYLSDLQQYSTMNYTTFAYILNAGLGTFYNDTSKAGRRIALIGDSYSQDFYNIIIEGKYLTNYEIRIHYVHVECQMYLGPDDRQQFILAKHKQMCTNAHDIKYALPLIQKANIVILASAWKPWSAKRLPTTIKLLNLTVQQQLLIIGTKHFARIDRMLYVNKTKEFRILQYQLPFQWFINVNKLMEQTIDPSIFVNVMKMICTVENNACPLFTPQGKLISYDNSHLTRYGAVHVGAIIFREKPLKSLCNDLSLN